MIDGGDDSSLLAAAAGAGVLSTEQVISNAAVLLFGGIETTEGMIATAALYLLAEPERADAARAEPAALGAAIDESLRLEPAAAVVDRYATADVVLGDAEIARGDLVRLSITAANRDPAVFADPDAFDPRRANLRRHVAFAQGPHVCVGVHLARLEARGGAGRVAGAAARAGTGPVASGGDPGAGVPQAAAARCGVGGELTSGRAGGMGDGQWAVGVCPGSVANVNCGLGKERLGRRSAGRAERERAGWRASQPALRDKPGNAILICNETCV